MSNMLYPKVTQTDFPFEYDSEEWAETSLFFHFELGRKRFQQLKAISKSTQTSPKLWWHCHMALACEKLVKNRNQNEGDLNTFHNQLSISRNFIADYILSKLKNGDRLELEIKNLQRHFLNESTPTFCKLGFPLAPIGHEKKGKLPAKIIEAPPTNKAYTG